MQSTNEELQSTNEELETSKEELQSVNEELVTVNAELQAKIEQLAGMRNDMKNLLDNINIGTVFLDEHLVIRSFTREAARVYHLVSSGRGPAAEPTSSPNWRAQDLLAEAQAVTRDPRALSSARCEPPAAPRYLARIQPYRTAGQRDRGRGADLCPAHGFQADAGGAPRRRGNWRRASSIRCASRSSCWMATLRVVSASRSFYQRFHVAPDETVGRLLYELGNRQWDIPALRELLETVLPRHRSFDAYAVEHDFPVIGRCRMLISARRIVGSSGETQLILLAIEMASPGA